MLNYRKKYSKLKIRTETVCKVEMLYFPNVTTYCTVKILAPAPINIPHMAHKYPAHKFLPKTSKDCHSFYCWADRQITNVSWLYFVPKTTCLLWPMLWIHVGACVESKTNKHLLGKVPRNSGAILCWPLFASLNFSSYFF